MRIPQLFHNDDVRIAWEIIDQIQCDKQGSRKSRNTLCVVVITPA